MKKICALLLAVLMVLTLLPAVGAASRPVYARTATAGTLTPGEITTPGELPEGTADFAVLSTTDMHGKCWDTNVLTGGAESNNMLKVKTAVNQIRDEIGADRTFLFDNGDLYQGTPVSSVQLNKYTAGESTDPLAMALCLADIGYTASGLGNHEFNYPWQTMEDARAYLLANGVPTVCANLYKEADGSNAFTPYIIKDVPLEKGSVKIGILGLESTDCTRWDIPDNYPGILFSHPDNPQRSIPREVERYVPMMRAEGAEFIVVLYHGGTGSATGDLVFGTNTEDQATRLIAQTEGVNMVIAGHDHSNGYSNTYIKNRNGEDVLIVNGGGTQLTKTVITVTAADGNVTFTVKDSKNLGLSSYTSDAALKAKLQPYADMAEAYVNQTAGKCIGTWDTVSRFYLQQSDSMDLIQAAQMYEGSKYMEQKYDTAEKREALFDETGLDHIDVDMSSTSVVVNGSYTVKAGDMTMKDIYRLYRYDNTLYLLPLTGAQIKAVLEKNASDHLKATVNGENVTYSTIGEDFTNPVFGGLNFVYDMSREPGDRAVIEGFANGRAFALDKTYIVGVNNYHLGNVGCGFGAYSTDDSIWSQTDDLGGGVVQDLILQYLTDMTASEAGGVDPATFNWTWKLDWTGPLEAPGLKGEYIARRTDKLEDGMKVFIHYPAGGTVIGTEPAENTNRLCAVDATAEGDLIGMDAPAGLFTVSVIPTPGDPDHTYYAFIAEDGTYLTSGETGNSLGFSDVASSLNMWYLVPVEGGYHVMNVGAAYGGNFNQALEWYTGFTTYGVKDTEVYVFDFYELARTASMVTELKDGGRYAIYYNAEGTFVSTEASGNRLAPVTNTVAGNKLILPADEKTFIFTAEIVATDGVNSTFVFKNGDGRYLTSGETGNSLSLTEECSDLSGWYLVPVEGGFHVMNVGAAYAGNHNQALEWYSGFTTYGVQNTEKYLFNFFEITGEEPPKPPCPHEETWLREALEPTCTEDGYSGDVICSACGAELEKGEILPALGHIDEDPADGICDRCNEELDPPAPIDPCEGFTDIDRSAWYHRAADFVIEQGLMGSTSTSELKFEPMTKVTRAMVASILYRIAESPDVEFKASFDDVKEGMWYTDAIEFCAQNSLASGKGNGKFDPMGNVTRQELAVFMQKMADYLGKDTSCRNDLSGFEDKDSVPSWSGPYLEWAVEAGIISGQAKDGKTYLNPTAGAMRCELASILMRFMEVMENTPDKDNGGGIVLPPDVF